MSTDTPHTLLELLRRHNHCATTLATPLATLALDNPAHAPTAIDALTTSLTTIIDNTATPEPITNAVLTVLPAYPESTTHLVEPLTRMTAHDDPTIRKEGHRCIGCLGALTEVNSVHLADILTDGVHDDDSAVRQAALWGLTKLGLTDPDAITGARTALINTLPTRPTPTPTTDYSSVLRRYAAEALAVMATGSIELDRYAPPEPPLELDQYPRAAAWAIQHTVTEHALPIAEKEHALHETNLAHDHGIAHGLFTHLTDHVTQAGDHRSAIAATLAVGYLAPGQDDMHDGLKLLNTLIDTDDGDQSRLAHRVLTHGPFTPAYPDACSRAVEWPYTLTAETRTSSNQPGNIVGLPAEIRTNLGADYDDSPRVVIDGHTKTVAQVRITHHHHGTATLSPSLRENIGVRDGDTVTITPITPHPARTVTLTIPTELPVDANHLALDTLRPALIHQSFTPGDTIAVAIITDRDHALSILDADNSLGRLARTKDTLRHRLPFHVADAHPDTATDITTDTVLTLAPNRTASLTQDFPIANTDIPEPPLPFVTLEQAVHTDAPDAINTLRNPPSPSPDN